MVPQTQARTALVIEDDEDIRGLLVQLLELEGFAVTDVGTAAAGLAAARALAPDLVTLDLNLPDGDGIEVCRELRGFSDAYIIMLTARVNELDKLEGLETGADDYIGKPFSPRELRARVSALFRRPRSAPVPAEDADSRRAVEVQRSLLPQEPPSVPGYDVGAAFQPCRNVGGDFYDWYASSPGLHVTVADAMGKGMGAALIAATARATLRSCAAIPDLGTAFDAAGQIVARDLEASGSFITVFHARLDPHAHRLDYVDAGHGLAVLVSPDGSHARLASSGPPVGIWPEQRWEPHGTALAPGQALAIISDGVLDAFAGPAEALEAVARATAQAPTAHAAAQAVLQLAQADSTGPDGASGTTGPGSAPTLRPAAAEDDVTAVVVRRQAA